MENRYTDCSKFEKEIGLLDEVQLRELGWETDNDNRICFSKEEKLMKFVDELNKKSKDKQYHIATELDSCELEESYREGLPDDVRVLAISMVNYKARVNRMDYYLCDGNPDPDLYLEFVEEL